MLDVGQFQILIKAFYQKVQKLNADFKIDDINQIILGVSPELCNNEKQIDFTKYKNDENYYTLLMSYCISLAIKQASAIFEDFKQREILSIPKPTKLLPNGWSVIDGGQK